MRRTFRLPALALLCLTVLIPAPPLEARKLGEPDRQAQLGARSETLLALRQEPPPGAKKAQVKDAPKEEQDTLGHREPDVVFWPTPQVVVDKMLEMAEIKKGDVLYDLGCGDGRILVTAAKKYTVKGYGFDIDPARIKDSLENVKKNDVQELVTIRRADIFTLDLKQANVVTLYLLPDLNVRLMPQLAKLKPGTRIVSHDFDMKGAKPNKVTTLRAKNHMGHEGEHTVYLWIVPWEKED
jgi:SAM-dependent methyltransferase